MSQRSQHTNSLHTIGQYYEFGFWYQQVSILPCSLTKNMTKNKTKQLRNNQNPGILPHFLYLESILYVTWEIPTLRKKNMVIYVPEQRTNHFSLIGLVYSGIFTLPTNWSKQKIKSANISVTRIPVPGNVTRIWDSKIFWYHLWECFFFKTSLRIATFKKKQQNPGT